VLIKLNELQKETREVLIELKELKKEIKKSNEELKKDIKKNVEELKKYIASLSYKESSIAYTNMELGRIEIGRLKMAGLMIDTPILEGEAPFWSKDEQRQALECTSEAAFTTFITPFFNEVLAEFDMVFVSSENDPWPSRGTLPGMSTKLKPDGFATHRGMYRKRSEVLDGFRSGIPEKNLYDCLILFESKLAIDDASFGQVVRYLHHFRPKPSASAVLFDRTAFQLFRSHKGVVYKVEKAKWAQNGSKSLFRDFIASNTFPWVTRLTEACNILGVDVVEGQAFLGRGARGRVFKVKRGEETFALKIVDNNSMLSLVDEARALRKAQTTGLTVEPTGKCIGLKDGAALLLTPVGEPLSQPQNSEDVANLYELLWKLHNKGVIHGDARVLNLILHGGKRLWIDLMELEVAGWDLLRSLDAEVLTRSILGCPSEAVLDEALVELIIEYGKSSPQQQQESINRLSTKVYECLRLPTSEASG